MKQKTTNLGQPNLRGDTFLIVTKNVGSGFKTRSTRCNLSQFQLGMSKVSEILSVKVDMRSKQRKTEWLFSVHFFLRKERYFHLF